MKALHVCYISQEYPPETGWGGIGSYTFEMAHGLAALGHRVTVISRAVDKETFTDEDGIAIHRVNPSPDWDSLPLLWRMNRLWPGFAWAAMLKLRAIHREHPIDIVEAAEGRADSFFVSYLPHRPKLITRLHTARIFIDQFNGKTNRPGAAQDYWLEKRSICRADMVTAPSKAILDLTKTWLKLNDDKALVIPNPISIVNFCVAENERAQIVLHVGRLETNKGAATIMGVLPELLEKFPVLEFHFMGADGTDPNGVSWRERILQSIDPKERNRVKFQMVSRGELSEAYRRAAVCILPSKFENAPYAALEAMACGTPVIACNSGGAPELIHDGVDGFLVPVDDAQTLAARIATVLTQPALRQQLGLKARGRVEQSFSLERVLPRMLDAYHHAMACA
jgi:glycosyltransferase involved in cell wall biosynthesis